LLRHRRLAASKLGSATIPVGMNIDQLMLALLDSWQVDALHETIEELYLPGLRWRFPRDKTASKLATKTQVLLTQCAPPTHPAGKGVWLVADGPDPRGPQQAWVMRAAVVAGAAARRGGISGRWALDPAASVGSR